MGRRVVDVAGQQYGKLVVVGLSLRKTKYGEKLWECKCECGGNKVATSTHLRQGRVKSCGCIQKTYGEDNTSWKGYKLIGSAFWGGYERGAKTRGIEFNLTIEEGWELYEKQQGKCFFTGQQIEFSTNSRTARCGTASLDRKDSSSGYTIVNCVWVHKDINRLKNNYSVDDFVKMCKMVASNFSEEQR